MSSLFSDAPWPECTLPAGGQCVLPLLSLELFMAAGAVYDIFWAGLQPLSSKPWGSAAAMTSLHLIPCMGYTAVH